MGRGEERVRYTESNMETYITICETDHQSRFDAQDRALRAGALG